MCAEKKLWTLHTSSFLLLTFADAGADEWIGSNSILKTVIE